MEDNQMTDALNNAGLEIKASTTQNILDVLSVEQRAALEQKFLALDADVRFAASEKYPKFGTVALYAIRQLVKESNGKLASNKRPVWYNRLSAEVSSLQSGEEAIRKYAERKLRDLAEEIDEKESVSLIKKYKQQHDLTSETAVIKQLCGIFGISPMTVK